MTDWAYQNLLQWIIHFSERLLTLFFNLNLLRLKGIVSMKNKDKSCPQEGKSSL